jgi:high-affinity Fe2+/Pb2+ permease
MNFDHFKNTFGKVHGHDLPAYLGLLVGIVLVFLMFKAEKLVEKLVLLLIAAVLFAGAIWWFNHIQS